MCDSPFNYFKTQISNTISRKNSNEEISRALITRDPFASLSRNNSNKLEPLSPDGKLPKINLALPPRPSLNLQKSNLLRQANSISKEELSKRMQSPSINSPASSKTNSKKIKRIKVSGSVSNVQQREANKITKKRNSVVVLDSENDLTFGLVGSITVKDRTNE